MGNVPPGVERLTWSAGNSIVKRPGATVHLEPPGGGPPGPRGRGTLPLGTEEAMATQTVRDLEAKSDAAWKNLTAQLAGMEPYLERADAPGEWTTREVLSHLLEGDDWKPAAVLASFAERDLPTIEI